MSMHGFSGAGPNMAALAAFSEGARDEKRSCTCHPSDNPPVPCAQKYALSECHAAAPPRQIGQERWIVTAKREVYVVRGVFEGVPYHSKLLTCEYLARDEAGGFVWKPCEEGDDYSSIEQPLSKDAKVTVDDEEPVDGWGPMPTLEPIAANEVSVVVAGLLAIDSVARQAVDCGVMWSYPQGSTQSERDAILQAQQAQQRELLAQVNGAAWRGGTGQMQSTDLATRYGGVDATLIPIGTQRRDDDA